MPRFREGRDAEGNAIQVPLSAAEESILDASLAATAAQGPLPIRFAAPLQVNRLLRTTNATATEILRVTLRPMTGYAGRFALIGVDAASGAFKLIEALITAKRLGAGALLVGTPFVINPNQNLDTASAAWAAGANVQGNDFVVTVTGAAGRTIDWSLTGSVVQFAPAGL